MRLLFSCLIVFTVLHVNAQIDTTAITGKWKVTIQQTKDLYIEVSKSGKQIKADIDSISSKHPELKWTTAQKAEHVKKMKKEASLLRKCNILFKPDGTLISKFLTKDDKVTTTQTNYKWLPGNILEIKSPTGEIVKAHVLTLEGKNMEIVFMEDTETWFKLSMAKQ